MFYIGLFYHAILIVKFLFQVSCSIGRNSRGQSIPLKVKGKWFHYILDKNGKIYNAQLFDFTAGMRRNI